MTVDVLRAGRLARPGTRLRTRIEPGITSRHFSNKQSLAGPVKHVAHLKSLHIHQHSVALPDRPLQVKLPRSH